MALGFILFLFMSIITIIGIILSIIGIIFIKKNRKIIGTILLIIGTLIIIPFIYLTFNFINNERINYYSTLSGNDYYMEYNDLNKEFYDNYTVSKNKIYGINIYISGQINGKGIIIFTPKSKDENKIIQIDLEENDDLEIACSSRNWDSSECLIHYIPENDLVEGNISIEIRIY